MGVITTCSLTEDTYFGPVSPTMTLADPAVLIGHRTCDTLPDIHTVKVSCRRDVMFLLCFLETMRTSVINPTVICLLFCLFQTDQ